MKNHLKYSILITLTLLITISLVNVQAAPLIGTTPQPYPYESNPTAVVNFGVGAPLSTGKDAMKDGDITSLGDFFLGAPHVLRPDGNSAAANRLQWLVYPVGSLAYMDWYEESSDADKTYVYTASGAQYELSTLEDAPPEAAGTITGVRVNVVARRTGGDDQIRLVIRLDPNELVSHTTGGIFPTSGATAYAAYSYSFTARPGTGTWSWDDINNLEAGVVSAIVGSTFTQVRVTQLWVEVLGPTTGYLELNTFANWPATEFPIGFVDLKIQYNVASALSDDTYNITYTTGTTWTTLQADTSDAYDRTGGPGLRPWSQVSVEDGSWDWTDIGNLRIRIGVTQNGGSWDAVKMTIFEVWASVYPLPLPPTGSTHLAVIPSSIYPIKPGEGLFVDIYVTDVTQMSGIYLLLTFDNFTLTPESVLIYDPFQYTAPAPPELNDTMGWVIVQQAMPLGESVGFTGSEPILRIYFTVDQPGTSKLNIINRAEFQTRTWPTGISESKVKNIYAETVPCTMDDGWVSTPTIMSFNGGLVPPGSAPVIGGAWHELYPQYSKTWTLTKWEDNTDGELSASDQIEMTNETGWIYWFHVDQVTITIHFTYKAPDSGTAEAEPTTPTTEPLIPGIGSTWHMIYPEYCRTFTITSHEDTDTDGYIDPSEQFDFKFDDEAPEADPHWAHLDSVTTDIWVTQKKEPEGPGVPEFPLGISVLMSLVALIPVIYVWRTRPQKKVLKR